MSAKRSIPRKTINIYTDGATLSNPGIGGWAVGYFLDGVESEFISIVGSEERTTNNRMELTAGIEALRLIRQRLPNEWVDAGAFRILTDSQYLQQGMTKWVQVWQTRDWTTSVGTRVSNLDLWLRLLHESQGMILSWEWIRGHSGNPGNDQVDRLAYLAATSLRERLTEP